MSTRTMPLPASGPELVTVEEVVDRVSGRNWIRRIGLRDREVGGRRRLQDEGGGHAARRVLDGMAGARAGNLAAPADEVGAGGHGGQGTTVPSS